MRRATVLLLAAALAACGPPTGNSRLDHPTPAGKPTDPRIATASTEPSAASSFDLASPSLSPSSSASPSASAVAVESLGPCPTVQPVPTDSSSQVHVDPELEAMLPTVLGRCPALVATLPGEVFSPGGDMCMLLPCGSQVYDLAKAFGLTLKDVDVGVVLPVERSLVYPVGIRLPGVATSKLIPERLKETKPYATREVKVGDRTVTWESSLNYDGTDYLIAHDDILFIVFYFEEAWPPTMEPSITPEISAVIEALP